MIDNFRATTTPEKLSWHLREDPDIEAIELEDGGLALIDPSGTSFETSAPEKPSGDFLDPESLPDTELQAEASMLELSQVANQYPGEVETVIAPPVSVDASGNIVPLTLHLSSSKTEAFVEPPPGADELYLRLSSGVDPVAICAAVAAAGGGDYASLCGDQIDESNEYVSSYAPSPDGGFVTDVATTRETAPGLLANSQLYTVDRTGAQRTAISDPHYLFFEPAWSPDGSEIAAVRCNHEEEECAVVRLQVGTGQESVVLSDAGSVEYSRPAFSADGTHLFVLRDVLSSFSEVLPERQIFRSSLTGASLEAVTAVVSNVGCGPRGHECNQGLNGPENKTTLAVDPDGESVYFSYHGGIYSVDAAGATSTFGKGILPLAVPANEEEDFIQPGMSSDSASVLFYRSSRTDRVHNGVWDAVPGGEGPALLFQYDGGKAEVAQPMGVSEPASLTFVARGVLWEADQEEAVATPLSDGDEIQSFADIAESLGYEEVEEIRSTEDRVGTLRRRAIVSAYPGSESNNGEKSFCIANLYNAVECVAFLEDKEQAAEMEEKLFTGHGRFLNSTVANAFRHGFWTALMAVDSVDENATDGLVFALLHEGDGPYGPDSQQDVINDFVGQHYGKYETGENTTPEIECEALRIKAANAIFIGARISPNRWIKTHNYQFRRLVYRKKRAGRDSGGPLVRRNGKTCAEAFQE